MAETEKKPRLCVFCGKDETAGPMNAEHFVPRCLWAGPRPKGTITVPAHTACNAGFADDNEYFRLVLVSDDKVMTHPVARQLLEGPVSRLMANRPRQYLRQAKDFDVHSRFSWMGLYLGEQGRFTIDLRRIQRVLDNIVKGIFYFHMGRPLAADRKIMAWNAEAPYDASTQKWVDGMSRWRWFGDDVFRCRLAFCDNRQDIAALLSFYGGRKEYLVATRARRADDDENAKGVVEEASWADVWALEAKLARLPTDLHV